MHHITVTLGKVTYFLSASSSWLGVETQIVDALRRGGGYVALSLVGGRTVEVLVSRGVRLVLGTGELSEDAA